jgi:asparagine synthase (glutamine-hydrolysing)
VFRYFGFVWDADNSAAGETVGRLVERLQASGSNWQFALRRPGLTVLYTRSRSPNRSYELEGDAGVVLGKLFARSGDFDSTAAPPMFGSQETANILATGGRHLLQRYWGRYVAFLHESESRRTRIVRDPTGGLPCFSMNVGGVEIYCSWMEDAVRLGLRFSIHWDYIAAHLCCQRLELNFTGLNEVTQVLGGECVAHRGGGKARTFYWDPLRVAEENPIEDPTQAVAALRRCTLDSVHAWASGYESIVHTLSGGLDSTIVLACLKDAPAGPQITCVNYHSPGAAGDERAFARLAAQRAGYELLERERGVPVSFEPLLHMPRSAAPSIYRYYLENSRREFELARERKATALFSGEGGDQLFYQARAAFGAGDYLYRRGVLRGLGSEFFRIALDGARVDRVSVWHVLRNAVLHACLGRRWTLASEIGQFTKLMCAEAIDAIKHDARWVHPHFQMRQCTPSGKLWHAYSLAFPALEYYDPIGILDGVERVAPLFSQPVLEVCLRIPVDVLTTGGWDRSIARRAFKHDLPHQIATRRGKGDPGEYVKSVLEHNFGFVREMLLEGQLVRQKFIDRTKLEAVLSDHPTRTASGDTEVYDYLNVEAWLQRFRISDVSAHQEQSFPSASRTVDRDVVTDVSRSARSITLQ